MIGAGCGGVVTVSGVNGSSGNITSGGGSGGGGGGLPLNDYSFTITGHDADSTPSISTDSILKVRVDAGPAALVFGSLRDLVIGVTLVLADGTVARSGGHVIKNVAGYDLAKLMHGSYGTLAGEERAPVTWVAATRLARPTPLESLTPGTR